MDIRYLNRIVFGGLILDSHEIDARTISRYCPTLNNKQNLPSELMVNLAGKCYFIKVGYDDEISRELVILKNSRNIFIYMFHS